MSERNQSSDAVRPPDIVDFKKFPVRPQEENPVEGDEYLVDIETHQTILVRRAESPEDAIVKAVTGNHDGSDLDLDVVAHDVHICIHTGIDEECDHDEEAD